MISYLLSLLVAIFNFVLFIYAVMSWFPALTSNNFYIELDKFFSKILDPIRKAVPLVAGKFDFSPIILIIILAIGTNLIFPILHKLGL